VTPVFLLDSSRDNDSQCITDDMDVVEIIAPQSQLLFKRGNLVIADTGVDCLQGAQASIPDLQSRAQAQLAEKLGAEIKRLHHVSGITSVYVTHDQIEAMTVGQRVAIMYRGNMEMLDTPSHVYNMPASIFCARFIGSPSMNIISCQYENGNLSIGDQMIRLAPMWRPIADACPSGKYCVGIRPEHVALSSRPTETSICGTVKYVEDYGNRYGVYIDVKGEKSELIAICNDSVPRPGENIFINIDFRKLHLFDAQSEKSLGYPEEIRRLNAALDFSMPDAQNKNQKAGGKYHESFGQYQCV
jgi:energy-coupling factor transporter ATP-binding protein EcfA2